MFQTIHLRLNYKLLLKYIFDNNLFTLKCTWIISFFIF